jgi:DNA/RNA-binding domain of Phe-tRNA-synthetase-like protein
VDEAVRSRYPDAALVILVADGLRNGPSDPWSSDLLAAAEDDARRRPDRHDAHVAAWRDAYRRFGVKPSRAASSVEALLRRARTDSGLPQVNRLVDAYNAISVTHGLPVGGEDADRLAGVPRLTVARGDEPFDTVVGGVTTVEHPAPGEVVWLDDTGVTCRRWNWRQGLRTRLDLQTTHASFVLERLAPYPLDALEAAADALASCLEAAAPGVRIARVRLGPFGSAPA